MKQTTLLLRVGLALFILWLAVPAAPVRADIGPKPDMTFTFEFESGSPQVILEGDQLQCAQSDCSDAAPLAVLGPQRFTCTETECRSMAYGYKQYHRLVIRFADRTRESNIFTKRDFNAHYTVTVRATDLLVTEDPQPLVDPSNFCNGWLGTLVVEVLAAALFLAAFNLPRLLMGWAALGSMLTLPFVWLVFPLLPVPPAGSTALAEAFATLAEAGLFYLASGRMLSFRQALLLSVVTNGASFAFGLLV